MSTLRYAVVFYSVHTSVCVEVKGAELTGEERD